MDVYEEEVRVNAVGMYEAHVKSAEESIVRIERELGIARRHRDHMLMQLVLELKREMERSRREIARMTTDGIAQRT